MTKTNPPFFAKGGIVCVLSFTYQRCSDFSFPSLKVIGLSREWFLSLKNFVFKHCGKIYVNFAILK